MSTGRSDAGFAMMTMMLLVVVVSGLVHAAATRTRLVSRSTVLERGKLVTFHAAAGGLSRARHALRHNPSYVGEELHIGSCRVTIQVRPRAATAKAQRGWQVVVLASHRSFGELAEPVRHRIEAELSQTSGLPHLLAFKEGGG